ncbi:leucine-rich repeat domain-containing protein [Hominilimicola sp.]|uniref:leucine-rich repeat domain-containing protein n=1 Tax=Hominilimicola sp. TaxID=3073571 RepID=UPI003994A12A
MKKIAVSVFLIILLASFCISSNAEINTNYYISNVLALQGEEYGTNIKAAVYGFEETDNLSLRVGELKNPNNTLIDKISEYKSQEEEVIFVELTAYDTEKDLKITLNKTVDMKITLSKNGLGSGFAGCMGKNYKVLKVTDNVKELSVVENSLYDVTFKTDELGIYAVIYNPYAISLSFMLDNENQYCQIDNLSKLSVVDLPESPQKNGYNFAGWYQRENGEGLCLYSGITLAEVATPVVYAYWVEDSIEKYPSTDSSMLECLTFDAETGTITKCDTSISGELVIPQEIDGVAVTEIGANAFASCKNLISVTIPGNVKKIGDYAFFNNWKLQTVTMWCGVTNIGDSAFSACRKLTNISIPDSVTSIGCNAFYNCTLLTNVTIPTKLTRLGDYAFKYCINLATVTIPDTLVNIPTDAFYGDTNLTNVTIGKGVKLIGTNAFYGCTRLTEIKLPENVGSINDMAFSRCENLKKVVIPQSVINIGANVFSETSEEFKIYGYGDSYAKIYADEKGITYVDITEPDSTPMPLPTIDPMPTPTPGPQVITVEPPMANVESGKVAYGTNVTLNPKSAHLAYSINGGEFVYKYFADTITITEDTTITVKSWIDALEPNTEYIIKEATYTYTVDEETVPKYPYVIKEMSLLSVSGEELNDIPNDSSFIVEVTLNEVQNRTEKDYIFVAVYSTDGQLLNLDYVKGDFIVNAECSFGFNIPAIKEPVGAVKAYVWNSFNLMEPLAESKTLLI